MVVVVATVVANVHYAAQHPKRKPDKEDRERPRAVGVSANTDWDEHAHQNEQRRKRRHLLFGHSVLDQFERGGAVRHREGYFAREEGEHEPLYRR